MEFSFQVLIFTGKLYTGTITVQWSALPLNTLNMITGMKTEPYSHVA